MLVKFLLNGTTIAQEVDPNETLLDFLRSNGGMTSVKRGCDEGACGACTILLNGEPVRSCLLLTVQVNDAEIVTVEGLAKHGKLDEVQQAFIEKYGFQCGFCTPGIILVTEALLNENPNPTVEEIKEALSGNLCRCTGYDQIIDSVLRAAHLRKL